MTSKPKVLRDIPLYNWGSSQPPRVLHAVLDNGDGTGTPIEGFMFLDEKPKE